MVCVFVFFSAWNVLYIQSWMSTQLRQLYITHTHLAYCSEIFSSINYIRYQRKFCMNIALNGSWLLLAHAYKVLYIVLEFWWQAEGNNHSLYPWQRPYMPVNYTCIRRYSLSLHSYSNAFWFSIFFMLCSEQYTFLATLSHAKQQKMYTVQCGICI